MTREEREAVMEVINAHMDGEDKNTKAVLSDVMESVNELETLEQEPYEDAVSRILKRMWNCRGKHTTSIDKVKMEQIIRDELFSVTPKPIECDNAISRDMALEKMADYVASGYADSVEDFEEYSRIICQLPSVTQKSGKCKNCKYFEYDSVAKVDGIPLIVAHEICNKWGNGCKTSEDGYCYLFEPQESEDKE